MANVPGFCTALYDWRIQGPNRHGPQTHETLCNDYGIVAENSDKYMPPGGFFVIHILLNSISAGAPPRTPLREFTTLP